MKTNRMARAMAAPGSRVMVSPFYPKVNMLCRETNGDLLYRVASGDIENCRFDRRRSRFNRKRREHELSAKLGHKTFLTDVVNVSKIGARNQLDELFQLFPIARLDGYNEAISNLRHTEVTELIVDSCHCDASSKHTRMLGSRLLKRTALRRSREEGHSKPGRHEPDRKLDHVSQTASGKWDQSQHKPESQRRNPKQEHLLPPFRGCQRPEYRDEGCHNEDIGHDGGNPEHISSLRNLHFKDVHRQKPCGESPECTDDNEPNVHFQRSDHQNNGTYYVSQAFHDVSFTY